MKKKHFLISALILCLCLALCACSGSRNLQEELPGTWEVCHWYYNEKNGDSGFFDNPMYCEFIDGKITVTAEDGSLIREGSYEFTGSDTLDVEYTDGTVASIQLLAANHEGVDQIQFMDVNTNYTLTLEPLDISK